MLVQNKSRRSPRGGRYKQARGKRLYETGSEPTHTKLGAKMLKRVRTKGGVVKLRLLRNEVANILNTGDMKCRAVRIKTVVDNSASKHFVRRNIITKGTVIDTEFGKARVTNRPGQEGTINAVLVK